MTKVVERTGAAFAFVFAMKEEECTYFCIIA